MPAIGTIGPSNRSLRVVSKRNGITLSKCTAKMDMNFFSDDIKFKYPWRTYQQRVLDELDSHLDDDHLHVIAPPGSGKTVLGLEVMLRLGRPTLILAPTLAVRNQWIQRFCELFMRQGHEPEWISKDIRQPKMLTVVTYQGLHAACNNRDKEHVEIDFVEETDVKERKRSNFLNIDAIVEGLKNQQVGTLVLDEAHHLKNEWWQTLTRVKERLQPKIVGLTATPPYDVSLLEWSRYIAINGAIDAEISVPELIKSGDLCPHQDFVYFTEATASELEQIKDFRHRAQIAYETIAGDVDLVEAIRNHPMILDPLGHEFYIFDNLAFYSSCLVFLSANGQEISPFHFELLGISAEEGGMQLPPLDFSWLEQLLYCYLFEEKGYFAANFELPREQLLTKLRRIGVVHHKSVRFEDNVQVTKRLKSSISKLKAIGDIVEFEYTSLCKKLRQVILTDYVRKEYLSTTTTNDIPLKKIGVMSIFEQLRRTNSNHKKLGVLTGSLVIIPQAASLDFMALTTARPSLLQPLAYDPNYLLITVDSSNRGQMVQTITHLFQNGNIEVLIGTQALLGEGWDAPAINSLVLASFIGSFVLSNQMRGRAIRTNPNVPNKTSNIWHLVSLDPTVARGGRDFQLMCRRFRNFVGVSEREVPSIENGLERLEIGRSVLSQDIHKVNQRTFELAGQRQRLADKWFLALPGGSTLVEEVKVPYHSPGEFEGRKVAHMSKTIGNMVTALGSSILFYVEWSTQFMQKLSRLLGANGSYALMGMFGVGTVVFGAKALRTFSYYVRYRDISKDIYHIGNALVKTLCKSKLFSSPLSSFNVLTYSDAEGSVFCHLDGGTTYEKSLFVQMIQEIVDPIDNPRYIIIRKSKAFNMVSQLDYHAVPEELGKRAALANDFLNFWQQEVGDATLVFTKSIEGRKVMIRSKMQALANHFSEDTRVQHVNVWR